MAAAWSLWQTKVPSGLELGTGDLSRIDAQTIARADRYESFFRIEFVVSELVLIGVLLAYARWGIRFARESAAGRIGTGMLLGMIGLALVWTSQVPFRLAEVWWSRRYDQTDSGYVETLFYELARARRRVPLHLLRARDRDGARRALPAPLVARRGSGLRRSRRPLRLHLPLPLLNRAAAPARPRSGRSAVREAAGDRADRDRAVEDVSDFTNAPNAYAVGFGPTKKIVFWNTMLDGSFSDGEVKVVLAHELGHHSRNHIPEGLAWYALFALPGAWLIARATRRRGGMGNPAAVPLSLLLIVVLDLVSLPVYNAISRHMEAEADWVALETTHDPDSAAGLFRNFTIESLNDPSPPAWSYLLLDSHPSVEQRIAMAEAWKARSR